MGVGNFEGQLELFDLANQTASRPQRESLGRVLLQVRYDQLILTGVGVILGLTVIFACGVERGKQLVTADRIALIQEPSSAGTTQPVTSRDASRASATQELAPPAKSDEPKVPASPAVMPTSKSPRKVVSGSSQPATMVAGQQQTTATPALASKSRYAIQVVTYTRPQRAQQAMAHLRAKGERTFLIIREGRTTVYVGPFPSKQYASQKLTTLKTQYQDCFVRIL